MAYKARGMYGLSLGLHTMVGDCMTEELVMVMYQ